MEPINKVQMSLDDSTTSTTYFEEFMASYVSVASRRYTNSTTTSEVEPSAQVIEGPPF